MISTLVCVYIVAGLTSGMWVPLSLLTVAVGIFLATVTLRKSEASPHGGRGARVITLKNLESYGIDSIEDLDEVA